MNHKLELSERDISMHLKLWYQFQETTGTDVLDLSGNNYHGSYGNIPSWGKGMIGSSFITGGSNSSYITIPKGVLKKVNNITIAARVKWTNSSMLNQWIYALGVDSKKYIFATPKGNSGKLYSAISNMDGSFSNQNTTGEQGLAASSVLPIRLWKHLVVTINSETNTSIMYVDGVEITNNSKVTIKPSDLYDASKDCSGYIGKSFHWDPGFSGQIDDFRIYSVALDKDEVAALTYAEMSDTQLVTTALADLSIGDTSIVAQDLVLPTTLYSTDITWKSSDLAHLDNRGRITRPAEGETVVKLDLTATVTKNAVTFTKDFMVTILPSGEAVYKVEVDALGKGVTISSNLFGLFFEDINYGLDGGLYPELVQNKSFEFVKSEDDAMIQKKEGLYAWYKLETGGGKVAIATQSVSGLNVNNPNYLEITAMKAGTGVGVYNTGFPDAPDTAITPTPGMKLVKDDCYYFSLYAKSDDYTGPIEVSLTSEDGLKVYALTSLKGVSAEWKKLSCVLQPSASTSTARLQILMKEAGVLHIDMVSLFPQKTWKNRTNGVRQDLGQMLGDMEPKFFRFPGGCLVEGRVVTNRYQWKDTVGPLEQRKSSFNNWAFSGKYPFYNQSNGFGFYEYFILAEDLGAEPIPCMNAGISHPAKGTFTPTLIPLEEMSELVQDAVDLVDFANCTDMNNPWARLRAEMGHAEPFYMKYLEIGNENGGEEYYQRYQLFSEALRFKYPELKLIADGGFGKNDSINLETWSRVQKGVIDADIVDEHYYIGPGVLYDSMNQYDNYDRRLGKVFLGEYATLGNTLENALSEAAYMTHLEENGDVVELAAYAPLFAKSNYTQWGTDAIFFDNSTAYGTVNYYIQMLFMKNMGHITLPSEIIKRGETGHRIHGAIGFATKNTAVQFEEITVTEDATKVILFRDDFTADASDWTAMGGNWIANNGIFEQADMTSAEAIAYVGKINADNYTVTLRAKKIGGTEGFRIILGHQDEKNYLQLNLGGWGNTKSSFEKIVDGRTIVMTPYYDTAKIPSIIENRWYSIKLRVIGSRIRCYIDELLQFDIVDRLKKGPIYSVASKDINNGDIIIKIVNPLCCEQMIEINMKNTNKINNKNNIDREGLKTVLKGTAPESSNSFETPKSIEPVTTKISGINTGNKVNLDPYSLTIFRFRQKA
jgi:alpha-L-arabinofuranosidase